MNARKTWFALVMAAVLMLGAVALMETAPKEPLYLTLEELARFDGQEGRPAYVAIDGVIYDMSESDLWKGGAHNGQQAGKDLSQEILELSPHGLTTLTRVPEVGRLVVEMTAEELAQFDGQEGRPAYVAIDGIIYDMSASDLWKGGAHNGQQAGRDLSREILELSPHGLSTLTRVPVVGRLILELSVEELAGFDGQEGRKAYIAANGSIYDVSDHPAWAGGKHAGFQAGADITQALQDSPHGDSVLEGAQKVGLLLP